MDPTVRLYFLHEAVGIGGFQLGQHPVVHNGRDNGVLVLQLFQHVGVGGVAGFGFLPGGESQLVEEQFSQLLGGIDVEGSPGEAKNQRLAVGDPPAEHFAEGPQLGFIDGNAPALHFVEHFAQGQLDGIVELCFLNGFQLLPQYRLQVPHGLGTGGGIGVLYGDPEKVGGQLGYGIIRLRGIQIVGRQGSIEFHLVPTDAQIPQMVQSCPGIVEDHALAVGQGDHLGLHRRQLAKTIRPGKGQGAVGGQVESTFFECLRQCFHLGQGLQADNGFRGGSRGELRTPQAVFVDEPHEFQLLEQGVELRLVVFLFQSVLRGEDNRGLRDDGGEIVGQIGAFLAGLQLFTELGPDRGVLQMLVNPVQGPKFIEQFLGGFGAYPGDTGDIVRGVAHQGL